MRRLLLLFVLVAGCEQSAKEPAPAPAPKPEPGLAQPAAPPPTPPKQATSVELTAVTLADDCGGTPPWGAPVKTGKGEAAPNDEEGSLSPTRAKAKSKADSANFRGAQVRRCEQTSMQLAISAGDASTIQVKSVELFDDSGKSLGMLTASKPTRWSDASSTYEAWDETVTAGSTSSVSYVLTQPKWDQIGNRWNKTFTLKTVVSVGGATQTAQRTVTLTAPTSLPPNVKT
jgi:hypothetical protein